jgi:hypothetical protein
MVMFQFGYGRSGVYRVRYLRMVNKSWEVTVIGRGGERIWKSNESANSCTHSRALSILKWALYKTKKQ